MASLLLPRRFYSQPQGAVVFADTQYGIPAFCHLGQSKIDLVSGLAGTLTNVETSASSCGVGIKASAASGKITYSKRPLTGGPFTIVCAFTADASTNYLYGFIQYPGTVNPSAALAINIDKSYSPASGKITLIARIDSAQKNQAEIPFSSGANVVAFSWLGNGNFLAALNGVQVTPVTENIGTIGSFYTGSATANILVSSAASAGSVELTVAYDSAMSIYDLVSLSANPWQLFKVSE